MNEPEPPHYEADFAGGTTAEIHSALFAQLVTGHAQMTLAFLGKLPNPQTGAADPPNTEAAQMFIDQLEMLEAKTKGNLNEDESRLLGQTLTTLRMAFVGVIERQLSETPANAKAAEPPSAKPETEAAEAESPPAQPEPSPAAAEESASKVKFSKKYG